MGVTVEGATVAGDRVGANVSPGIVGVTLAGEEEGETVIGERVGLMVIRVGLRVERVGLEVVG
eukprot:408315-Amorphochlora_amoeboformis.AAC.1